MGKLKCTDFEIMFPLKYKKSIEQLVKMDFIHEVNKDDHFFYDSKIKMRGNSQIKDRCIHIMYQGYGDLTSHMPKTLIEKAQIIDSKICLESPTGINVCLSEEKSLLNKPERQSMNGEFHEISIQTDNLIEEVAFWEKLNFKITYGSLQNDNWVSMRNELFQIGLYQKKTIYHIFKNPAITFFNYRNELIIEKMKESGFKFSEEIKENGITIEGILEIENQHFFIFKA